MIHYGKYNTLRFSKLLDFGAYLTDGADSILLPAKYVPQNAKIGDEIQVFVYCDSEDRPIATTRIPAGCAGDFVCLKVVSSTRIGAFLDWGLEKDLFVPFKEMQNKKMSVGESYLVQIRCDEVTNRIIGSNRFDRLFRASGPPTLTEGNQVKLLVYEPTPIGFRVIVNRKYAGLLYLNELHQKVAVGDSLTGFVARVRDDGKLDCRLRSGGREAVRAGHDQVLAILKEKGGVWAYSSQTPPEEIERVFSMSKKLFKQIIGALYKERLIAIEKDSLRVL